MHAVQHVDPHVDDAISRAVCAGVFVITAYVATAQPESVQWCSRNP